LRLRIVRHKAVRILDDVLAHRSQIRRDLGRIRELAPYVFDLLIHEKAHQFVADALQGLAAFPVQGAGLAHGVLELLHEFGAVAFQALLGLGIQPVISLRTEHFAVDHRRDVQAHLRPDQRKASLL